MLHITHVRSFPSDGKVDRMGWDGNARRRAIKLSNAIWKDEEVDLIIGTEFDRE